MPASEIAVGIEGGEEFAAAGQLRPRDALIVLVDSAVDDDGAFGRRQNDVRAVLDGDATLVLLVGPMIESGLATQFGCWIRAKVGLDILPWEKPRALSDGGEAYATIRFFGRPPDSVETIARTRDGELAGVRYRGGAATIVVAPLDDPPTVEGLLRRSA